MATKTNPLPKPPVLQLAYPQKTNRAITVLCEQSVGDYNDRFDLDPKDLAGKDPANIHVRLDIKYGYYDDRSYTLMIEEIIPTPNPNYNQEKKEYERAIKEYEAAMVEYHASMAAWHAKKVKSK